MKREQLCERMPAELPRRRRLRVGCNRGIQRLFVERLFVMYKNATYVLRLFSYLVFGLFINYLELQ
jgi:hypothetical protein